MLQCIWVIIFFFYPRKWIVSEMKRNENSFQAVALDLMLRTFMNASEFDDISVKFWPQKIMVLEHVTVHLSYNFFLLSSQVNCEWNEA